MTDLTANHQHKIEIDKLIEAEARLADAIAAQKAAVERLTTALSETEASRSALHAAGLQCWIDRLHKQN